MSQIKDVGSYNATPDATDYIAAQTAAGTTYQTKFSDFVGVVTYVHPPTGTVGTDKVVLADAVSDTPAHGLIVLANGGTTPYATDEAWTIGKDLRIEGAGVVAPIDFANGETALTDPFLHGPVLLQTAAATDGINITHANANVALQNLGIRFDDPGTVGFADTGHGIKVDPGASALGLSNVSWSDLWVFGHDGDHYAFNLIAPLLCQFYGLRSIGGGMVRIAGQSGVAAGNLVFVNPFGSICCAGAAHGIGISAANITAVGLLTWIRPQVNDNDFSASAAYGNPAAPDSDQYLWNDLLGAGYPGWNSLHDATMEQAGAISSVNFGSDTYLWGHPNSDDNLQRVAFGHLASAGQQGVSVGHLAAAPGIQSTGIGTGATASAHVSTAIGGVTTASALGAVAIGVDSSFTGASSAAQDHYVHGTALHKHFIPGLPTSDPAVAGQLWNNAGTVKVSAG